MEWIVTHRGDLLIIGILAAVTVTVLLNLLRKKGSHCGSCKGCSMSCPNRQK